MEDENRESGEAEVRAFNLRPVQVEALENVRASWRTRQRAHSGPSSAIE